MSGRALQAFSTGITVAGQNISNANTPGYIREELTLDTNLPYESGQLVLGTGVQVDGIRQQVNRFLETRLHAAKGDQAAAQASSEIYLLLENAINELGDEDLSTALSNFVAAVQDVANEPDNVPLRQRLISQGEALARDIVDMRGRVDALREGQSLKVVDLVKEANGLIDEIDRLNPQITRLEASGLLRSDAGALRTQRYNAMQRLSEIVPIRYRDREDGGVDVFMGGDYLVLDGAKQHLEIYEQADRDVAVSFVRTTTTRSVLPDGGGELRGIIDGRDQVLGGFVDDLNAFAANLISGFNRLHASGEGRAGYEAITAEHGVTNSAAALNAAGLPFAITHGGFDLKIVNAATGEVTTTRIAIDLDGLNANDTTLTSLAGVIDGLGNVDASVDAAGRLNLSAAAGYELKFGDDTSGALAALGINTFFSGTDADSIGVRTELKTDHRLFASGRGGGVADNSNASALAVVLDGAMDDLGGQSLSGFYDSVISKVGQGSSSEQTLAEGATAYVESLQSQREQYSGVSLDEETIAVMQFQRSFQSAARMISVIDELLGVLLSV
jgi:flagellar hook-associated protein 1 FlgK